MENRVLGLERVYALLVPLFKSYPLEFFGFSPDYTIDQIKLPAVIILEGADEITKRASRGYLGYPAKRELEIIVECWDSSLQGCRDLYQQVRSILLVNEGVLIPSSVVVREIRAVGPFNLDLPAIKGIRIIFGMNYTDSGPPS